MITKNTNRMIDGAAVNVLDFGAVGDGVTDDTAAIQAAIDSQSGGGAVFLPNGEYLISSTLTAPCGIRLIGNGTESTKLVASGFTTSTDLIQFTAPTEPVTGTSPVGTLSEVSKMGIYAKGSNAGYGISTPKVGMLLNYKPSFSFTDLLFRGYTTVSGWIHDFGFKACIRQGDCLSSYIQSVQILGTYKSDEIESNSPEQTGIYLDADSAMRNVTITDVLGANVKYGIDLGDANSAWISDCDFSKCWVGIRTVATGNGAEIEISNCNFNAARIGVQLKNRSWAVLQGCQSTRSSNTYDHDEGYQSFLLTNLNNSFISNCRALVAMPTGGFPALKAVAAMTAFEMQDVVACKFVNILCATSPANTVPVGDIDAITFDYGFRMLDNPVVASTPCRDCMFTNVFFDDVNVWWYFGAGSADMSIGNHSHRGGFINKYGYDVSITETTKQGFQIQGDRANFDGGLLLVDPDDKTVSISMNSRKIFEVDDNTVKFGTHAAVAAETVTGYITIVDEGGITRKLAVVS